jgi:Nif-specific regulatory protein
VVDPVGSGKTEPIDVRVIAATNKVLLDEIRAKTFREDLYYRLSIIPIHLPPLRERREDIPLLVEHFLAQYRARFEKRSLRLTEHALRQLLGHPWSGNVRELRNVLERSVIFAESELIDRVHFDESRGAAAELTVVEAGGAPLSTGELLRRRASESLAHSGDFDLQKVHDVVDRVMLDACLRVHKGVHQQAAKALGISRETLRKRVRELEIDIYHP